MKYGARNEIIARVKSIKSDPVKSLIKFDEIRAEEMASVITTESVEQLNLKQGDEVRLAIKAIYVLPVKE